MKLHVLNNTIIFFRSSVLYFDIFYISYQVQLLHPVARTEFCIPIFIKCTSRLSQETNTSSISRLFVRSLLVDQNRLFLYFIYIIQFKCTADLLFIKFWHFKMRIVNFIIWVNAGELWQRKKLILNNASVSLVLYTYRGQMITIKQEKHKGRKTHSPIITKRIRSGELYK